MIVIGETGSGKTTQLPQYILQCEELIGGSKGRTVAITQPRRIAAITVAERVCSEVGCRLGEEVGYIVRFDDVTSPR